MEVEPPEGQRRGSGGFRRWSRRVPRRLRQLARPRWLLALPLLSLAWPGLYNRQEPAVLGVPFYYAYQLGVIALAVVTMVLVHRHGRGGR